jgi:phosphate-selective porin OprO/OprP
MTHGNLGPMVLRALRGLRFGSVEIVVHDGRVVHGASRGDDRMRVQRRRIAGAWAFALWAAAAGPALAEEKKPAEAPKLTAGSEGFVLQSANGDYKLQLRGYVHFDGRFFPSDEGRLAVDNFLLRRVRPILAGTVGRHFEFQIMPDFGMGTTVVQDAWLDVNYSPKARVRVGKFKSPVGLERLQSATALAFVERAYPTAIVPNRDVGVMLHGDLGGGVLAYAAGLFDGAPDGGSVDLDLADGKDVAGRVFLSPFKRGSSTLKDLGFGIAGTTGKQTGALPAYRSGGQVSLLTLVQGITADGTRNRLSPQLSFYSGRLGLMAEYAWSESWVQRASTGTRARFSGEAWQATATFTLTGEKASYSALRPAAAFEPGLGKWGALELAARVNGLEVGTEAFREGIVDPAKSVRRAFAWAVGLNWSLSRNVKQVLDFERTTFTGGATDDADRPAENAFFIRTQVSF